MHVVKVLPSYYRDSVILMNAAREAKKLPGVTEAAAFMGTRSNHAILEQIGMASDETRKAEANDLILAAKGETEAAATAAINHIQEMLNRKQRQDDDSSAHRPKSLAGALRQMPEANVCVVSVAGGYAFYETQAALRQGLHVMVFSDNVPVEEEVELKRIALERNLLCMGPDCGTAWISGVGLGFFNVVPRGRIGLVAASGTGLQATVCRLTALGEGVSHGIGIGGRDLSKEVGGAMALAALDCLAKDKDTDVVVLVSKPPHPSVMAKLKPIIDSYPKPLVICCLGQKDKNVPGRVYWTDTLAEAAGTAVGLRSGKVPAPAEFDKSLLATLPKKGSSLLGLYTGGTLMHESELILKRLAKKSPFASHLVDLGDDQYTAGRPHPMIDPAPRVEWLEKLADDPRVGVLLLDFVLGHGSHMDPVGQHLEALAKARAAFAASGRELRVIAAVIGASGDPQGYDSQISRLKQAGVTVFETNSEAALFAAMAANPEAAEAMMEG